MFRGAFKAPNC